VEAGKKEKKNRLLSKAFSKEGMGGGKPQPRAQRGKREKGGPIVKKKRKTLCVYCAWKRKKKGLINKRRGEELQEEALPQFEVPQRRKKKKKKGRFEAGEGTSSWELRRGPLLSSQGHLTERKGDEIRAGGSTGPPLGGKEMGRQKEGGRGPGEEVQPKRRKKKLARKTRGERKEDRFLNMKIFPLWGGGEG